MEPNVDNSYCFTIMRTSSQKLDTTQGLRIPYYQAMLETIVSQQDDTDVKGVNAS